MSALIAHRHLPRIEGRPAQPRLQGGEGQHAIGGDHHRGGQFAGAAHDGHPGNPAIPQDHVLHGGAGDQGGAGRDRLVRQPAVEAGPEDRVAVVRGAVEVARFMVVLKLDSPVMKVTPS